MALRIRLARMGAKKKPCYRVVVAENTAPRDGAFKDRVGSYYPLLDKDNPNRVVLNSEKIKHWVSVGAKPVDTVKRLMKDMKLKVSV